MHLQEYAVGDVIDLMRRPVTLDRDSMYQEIGLRSFGRGVFHKDPVRGEEIENKKLFHILPGDLLFSNVFAWEGAVALASESERGLIGSHRFMTYQVNESAADTRYLRHYFAHGPGLQVIQAASPGSAGRNRTLGIKTFAAQAIKIPDRREQQRIADKLDLLLSRNDSIVNSNDAASLSRAKNLSVSAIDHMLDRWKIDSIRVEEACDIISDVVHPGENPEPAKEFVGLEHVESHIGRRIGSRSLGNENGRKFRFQPGDVLYGYLRPYLNKVWVADRHGLCSVEQYVLRPNGVMSAELIAAALRSKRSLDRIVDLTHNLQLPRLRSRLLMSLDIPFIPAGRQSQAATELTTCMKKCEHYVDLITRRNKLLASFRSSILNAAFTGHL